MPFCGFGLFALLSGSRAAILGGSKQSWALAMAGLVFTIVGGGLLTAAIWGSQKLKKAEIAQGEHPGQPWLWREDWSHGRATSKTQSSMLSAWVMATLWMLVSSPILFVIPKEQFQREPKTFIALLFPVAGIFLVSWAVRETMRWLEFGNTYFDMPIVPLVVGREVRGTIQARFSNTPERGVQLKLSCIHRTVTGSGKNQSVQEKIVWRDEKTVPSAELCAGPIGTSIPVAFAIPADAEPTNHTNPRALILWVLEADADVPGVDYKDIFEVPVFRTKDTPTLPQSQEWGKAPTAPAYATIVVRPSADGGTEFYFPPARNKGFAAGTTVFTLVWSGVIAAMIALHAPFFFPLVFGLFDALLIFITLDLWVGTSTVVIGRGAVRVRAGLLGMGSTQEISCAQIAKIQAAITAQQGGATGTPYYDIQLVQADGKKITLGKTIREKQEADWLVSEMTKLAGGKPKAMSAAAG